MIDRYLDCSSHHRGICGFVQHGLAIGNEITGLEESVHAGGWTQQNMKGFINDKKTIGRICKRLRPT